MEESIGSRVARRRPVDVTTKALSIPEIRKIIADCVMSPRRILSFCRLRAVNHSWKETALDVMKDQNNVWLRLAFTGSHTLETEQFLTKVTPNALLPLMVRVTINNFDVQLASRFARDYSHMVVRLDLSIEGDQGPLSGLKKKLEAFQGRNFSGLKTVNLKVRLPARSERYPMRLIQNGLDAIEQLTGSLESLTQFQLKLLSDFADDVQLVFPSRLTNIPVHGWSSFLLLHPENRFPDLKVLEVDKWLVISWPIDFDQRMSVNVQTSWRHFIELHTKLETLKIFSKLPVPLYLPRLKYLKEIHLDRINVAVETQRGSDVLPHLTTVYLCIGQNFEEGDLTTQTVLLRNASRFTLKVIKVDSQNAPLRMDVLCEAFSNVTKLELKNNWGWDDLVLPLSHVFRQMTTLQEIDMSVKKGCYPDMDLCCLLTGLRECEISEEEKDTILNGRRDVVTNLRRLKSLRMSTFREMQQLGPFLFQTVFPRMSELTEINFISLGASRYRGPFTSVREMATNLNGKQIKFSFFS